jgi:hypothetical protein
MDFQMDGGRLTPPLSDETPAPRNLKPDTYEAGGRETLNMQPSTSNDSVAQHSGRRGAKGKGRRAKSQEPTLSQQTRLC